MTAILIDVGGMLAPHQPAEAAVAWGRRLGISPRDFLAALFAGNDDKNSHRPYE